MLLHLGIGFAFVELLDDLLDFVDLVHAGLDEQRLEVVVLAEENVGVQAVADHQELLAVPVDFLLEEDVAKPVLGLAHDDGFPLGARFDGAHHGAGAGNDEVGHRKSLVGVGSDENRRRVVEVRSSFQHLRKREVLVEADDDGADFRVGLELFFHERHHAAVQDVWADAGVLDADRIQLPRNPGASDDVNLPVEVRLLQVLRRQIRSRDHVLLNADVYNFMSFCVNLLQLTIPTLKCIELAFSTSSSRVFVLLLVMKKTFLPKSRNRLMTVLLFLRTLL